MQSVSGTQPQPFVSWRLPGEKEVYTLTGTPERINSGFVARKGFLVAPYTFSSNKETWFFPAGEVICSDDFPFSNEFIKYIQPGRSSYALVYSSKSLYIQQFKALQQAFEAGRLRKAVLSRLIHNQEVSLADAVPIYQQMLQQYPQAMVYLTCLPGGTCWTGASPELLLKVTEGRAFTTSVAATQPEVKFAGDRWNRKEKEEQQIVTDYILSLLQSFDVQGVEKQGPKSYRAGNVWHLRTNFAFPAHNLYRRFDEFLAALHPTPAVCGMPKQKTYHELMQTEQHERELYAGFLGPVNMDNKLHLFVNLRNMQLFADGAALYAGGGLTLESDPRAEWRETNHKAATMLNVIEAVKKHRTPPVRNPTCY